jgi:hypothetical protein
MEFTVEFYTGKFLVNYYTEHGSNELIKLCNVKNTKGRNSLQEFILKYYDNFDEMKRERIVYDLIANGHVDVDYVSDKDGVSSLDLLRKINYDINKFRHSGNKSLDKHY